METTIYTVKQFNELVNTILQDQVGEVTITGEISGYQIRQNKWVSFDLKDKDSVVNCFTAVYQLDFPLEDGMEVLITGTPRIYVPYGKYSLNVRAVEPKGEGALKKAFDELKAKLEKEGLFEAEHKRPLPRFPEKIGIITSGEGAAVNDILKVINHRWSGLELFLAPVLVQGKNAPDELVGALEYFNQHHHVDIIIFGRGGGSLEDLQAFNSERVARAIFSSRIPIVAGIGHEHNTSIADLVADVRAATPSNAAEIAVPDREAIAREIAYLRRRAEESVDRRLTRSSHNLQQQKQTLQLFMSSRMGDIRLLIQNLGQKMDERTNDMKQQHLSLIRYRSDLIHRMNVGLERATTRTIEGRKLLYVLSPNAILSRGYSITYQAENGKPIASKRDIPARGRIRTQVSDGSFESFIGTEEEMKPVIPVKTAGMKIVSTPKEEQSTLF